MIDRLAAEGRHTLLVVPLFLAPGTHTGTQLQAMLADARRRWPGLSIDAGPTLTELAPVRAAIVEHALAGLRRPAAE